MQSRNDSCLYKKTIAVSLQRALAEMSWDSQRTILPYEGLLQWMVDAFRKWWGGDSEFALYDDSQVRKTGLI